MLLSGKQVESIWQSQQGDRAAINKRRAYYEGRQTIAELLNARIDGRVKSKVVTNWTKYASAMHAGFLTSIPATYTIDGGGETPALRRVTTLYRDKSLASQDRRLFVDAITYGFGVEVLGFDGVNHRLTRTQPWEWSLVRDEDGAIAKAVRQVTIAPFTLYRGDLVEKQKVLYVVYDDEAITTFERADKDLVQTSREDHRYGRLPLVIYHATEDQRSFFSDAFLVQADVFDITRSSLQDDIKHNVDSLLKTTGLKFEPLLEKDKKGRTVLEKLKEIGVLPLPEGGTADYISRTVDIEKFKYDLSLTRQGIHLMACLPDLDETISGNEGTLTSISGVALKLMFQSMIQQASEFSSQFTKGLRERVALMNTVDEIRGLDVLIDYDVTLSKNLPFSDTEFLQYLGNLDGVVSRREKLRLLPFVTDAERVLRELEEENTTASPTPPEPVAIGSGEG